MDVLRIAGDRPKAPITRVTFDETAPDALLSARSTDAPAVYLVPNSEIDRLLALDGAVDRNTKHPTKNLAKVLLGYEGIPIIRGSHTRVSGLRRSIDALIANAKKERQRNLYVIGVNDVLFKKLLADAKRRREVAPEHRPPEVLDLLVPVPIPPELEREFIGSSPASRLVRQLIMHAAQSDQDVLILGDTGTGKEVVARAIHRHGGREPFVEVNCGALGAAEIERALFGAQVAPGSSEREHVGAWQEAGMGVLFLDEIDGLRPEMQAKVVAALENGSIHPVDGRDSFVAPARVIASSNRDLDALVRAEQFRGDLYYHLRRFTIVLSPLRKRPEDIVDLAQRFWVEATDDENAVLPADILAALQTHHWPGNARELRAVLFNVRDLFGVERLRVEHVRAALYGLGQVPAQGPLSDGTGTLDRINTLRHLRWVDEVLRACLVTLAPVVDEPRPSPTVVAGAHTTLHYRLHELELLCLQPLLFGNDDTFLTVNELKGNLAYFHELLERDVKEALHYWNKELATLFAPAQAAVLEQQERVTTEM